MYFHMRALRHARPALTEDKTTALMVTLVQSRLDYANSILFKTSTSNIKKLQTAQTHWHTLFSQISGQLQLHLSYFAYILVMLILCFKYKLATITSKSCQQHNQPTCICYFSSINPIDPFCQVARTCWHSSKFGRHAFICCAPSVWNKLPLSVRSLNSFNSFKSHLKTHLFAHY